MIRRWKMKRYLLIVPILILAFASLSWADIYTLDVKGETATLNNTTPNPAYAILYTDAMNDMWTSSGSGVINPFLTVQANGSEKGMNTDGSLSPYDAKRGANPGYTDGFTHSLQYSDLRLSPFGVYDDFFNFSLDADQNNNTDGKWILLTDFEVWKLPQGAGGFLTTYESLALNGGEKKFDLTGDEIMLDYSVWAGSGSKLDMALLVPFFSGNPTDYIYVWTEFGIVGAGPPHPPAGSTNDGPEEWIMFGNSEGVNGKVPEPTTLLLLGFGLAGAIPFVRRRFKR
jgi:hypothetical protein